MESRVVLLFIVLSFVALALFVVDLATGAVPIPLGDVWAALAGGDAAPATAKIVRDIRLVKAVVAVAAGMALSVSGLQMQTLFRNPLAGPYVLGISSGASLGVALFILGAPLFGAAAGGGGPMAWLGMAGAAWVGSASILLVIAAVSRRIRDIMVILILGMMFSSGVGAVVQILQYLSREEALKSFVIWTMGSLGDVTAGQLARRSRSAGGGRWRPSSRSTCCCSASSTPARWASTCAARGCCSFSPRSCSRAP